MLQFLEKVFCEHEVDFRFSHFKAELWLHGRPLLLLLVFNAGSLRIVGHRGVKGLGMGWGEG